MEVNSQKRSRGAESAPYRRKSSREQVATALLDNRCGAVSQKLLVGFRAISNPNVAGRSRMKRRVETIADIEKKIEQCSRRLKHISDRSDELKVASAEPENWPRNLSPAE